VNTWPFPPAGGPVPWTKAQERAYQQQRRDQYEEAPW